MYLSLNNGFCLLALGNFLLQAYVLFNEFSSLLLNRQLMTHSQKHFFGLEWLADIVYSSYRKSLSFI